VNQYMYTMYVFQQKVKSTEKVKVLNTIAIYVLMAVFQLNLG